MIFSSMTFLWVFLPIVLILYQLPFKTNYKNALLLIASLLFYAWGEPKYILLMLVSIVMNYGFGLACGNLKRCSKLFVALSVVANLGLLFYFKYFDFFADTVNKLTGNALISLREIALPIGISFYTFQALSYVVDVYRQKIKPQKNLFLLALYISFFPQLIAGPIVRYTTIEEQISKRKITIDCFSKGILRFLYGFNKKMLLANILAQVADFAFAEGELSIAMAWLGIICYTLQIFFDFSGYSEMAIGLGLMFGFEFLENFDYPYISKTITEFWRRWHMSLGSWFRDYLYFPLGGSRVKSKIRLVLNLFVVWFATGVWHGASWNFILWGVLYGVIITVEKLFSIPDISKNNCLFRVSYQIFTLLMVMLGWVLFRAEGLTAAGDYLQVLFGVNATTIIDENFIFYLKEYFVILLCGIVCCAPIIKSVKQMLSKLGKSIEMGIEVVSYTVQFVLFLVSVSYLVMNAHNPFIYFNF